MKTKLMIALAALMLTATPHVTYASEPETTVAGEKVLKIKDFNAIRVETTHNRINMNSLSGRVYIDLIKSSDWSVVTEGNDVQVSKSGNELVIKYDIREKSANIHVTVNCPEVKSIHVGGIAEINCSGNFKTDKLSIKAGGASKINGANFKAKTISLDVNGACKLHGCNFSADELDIDFSGATNMTSAILSAHTADIDLNGASKVNADKITIKGRAEFDFSGASGLTSEDASLSEVQVDITGASNISLSGSLDSIHGKVSGASKVNLSGDSGKELKLDVSGASKINAENFRCKSVSIRVSGASKASVYASERISCEASGTSRIDYYGHPKHVESRNQNIVAH